MVFAIWKSFHTISFQCQSNLSHFKFNLGLCKMFHHQRRSEKNIILQCNVYNWLLSIVVYVGCARNKAVNESFRNMRRRHLKSVSPLVKIKTIVRKVNHCQVTLSIFAYQTACKWCTFQTRDPISSGPTVDKSSLVKELLYGINIVKSFAKYCWQL